jgi:cytochrome b561
MMRDQRTTYGTITQVLHWLIAFIIILMLISGYAFDFLPKSAFKTSLKDLHKSVGLSLLCLMLIRVGWRVWNPWPALPEQIVAWQRQAARGVHLLLYLFGIIMPISGWVMSVAAQHPPMWFGLFELSLPIAPSKFVASNAHTVHLWVAWLFLGLIALHTSAAFLHGLGENGVIWRMLPKRKDDR